MDTDREQSESRQTAKASQEQRELLRVTLSSIGDAVITTDKEIRITFLNPVAETLTGWMQEEATGVPLERVFRIVNEDSPDGGEPRDPCLARRGRHRSRKPHTTHCERRHGTPH